MVLLVSAILIWGDKMCESQQMLASILQTAQVRKFEIKNVLRCASRSGLRSALKLQLKEYEAIEREASTIAVMRGWELPENTLYSIGLVGFINKARFSFGDADSKIAAKMIQSNTRDMIDSIRNKHHCYQANQQISTLSQKLIDCELAAIQKMQGFL